MRETKENYFVECVPNISEGRDQKRIERILEAINISGITILDVSSGMAANRSVLTLVGPVEKMFVVIKKLYEAVANEVDMSVHNGNHPRIGAIDVCPFICFEKENILNLKERVLEFAKTIAESIEIPVFLYALSSKGEGYKTLPDIRKGEYEALMLNPEMLSYLPDYGKEYSNRKFGATVMGVRDFMIAYNINLDTTDLVLVKKIAKEMRSIRRNQQKNHEKDISQLQILGWFVDEYGCCQISTNIHNPAVLTLSDVYHFAKDVAFQYGIEVISSELIGMLPLFAWQNLTIQLGMNGSKTIRYLGLDSRKDISEDNLVIEYALLK